MRHLRSELHLPTTSGTDILDITSSVEDAVARADIDAGLVVVFVPGSTGAVTTIEFEDGCLEDLRQAVERLVPSRDHYAHNARWGDGNGYSHLRAALVGPSLAVPTSEGRPILGTWQQIVVCDFDNRPRRRRVLIDVWGQ